LGLRHVDRRGKLACNRTLHPFFSE